LVLSNNGSDNLAVGANGTATFATALNTGAGYAVTVAAQPSSPAQACVVSNGKGSIGSANVTVMVNCATNTFTVSATVTGLAGSGLVLQNNFGDDLPVQSSSTVTFASAVASGGAYNVVVLTQPTKPVQQCTVTNGSGTVTNAPIASVAVACVTPTPQSLLTLNYGNNTVSLYLIDGNTGQPRAHGSFAVGTFPTDATDDGQGHLYVLNSFGASISAFQGGPQNRLVPIAAGTPYSTGSTSSNSVTLSSNGRTLYVANATTNDISAWVIVQPSGALSPVAGSRFKAGTNPGKLIVDAANRFAYVANGGSNDIYTYSIDPATGALTEVPGSRVATGTTPADLQLHRTGKFVYVASTADPNISGYRINASTGVLTPIQGSPFATPAVPGDVTPLTGGRPPLLMHPNGKLLFVRSTLAKTVSVMKIDPASGALTLATGSPYGVGDGAVWLTLDPSGQFLYVANRGTNTLSPGSISAFKVDTSSGALTEITGSPFGLSGGPAMVKVDPSGQFLFAASGATDLVYGLKIDQVTGALTPLGWGAQTLAGDNPVAIGFATNANAESSALIFESKHAYVPNATDGTITGYAADPMSGALSTIANSPFTATGIQSLVAPATGQFVYATNPTSGSISQYNVDAASGALSPSANPPTTLQAGATPGYITTDAAGQFVYVIDQAAKAIDALSADPVTGALASTFYGTSTLATTPIAFAVSGNGRLAYSIRNPYLESYVINNAGILGGPRITSRSAGINPAALAVHPNGFFVYVADASTPGAIHINVYDPLSGDPSATIGETNTPTGDTPVSIAIDPTGRFLYTANNASNDVSSFSIDQGSGALTPIQSSVATGNHPVSVTVDAGGRFLYVVNSQDKTTSTYTIDAMTGALTTAAGAPLATGAGPTGLALSFDVETGP